MNTPTPPTHPPSMTAYAVGAFARAEAAAIATAAACPIPDETIATLESLLAQIGPDLWVYADTQIISVRGPIVRPIAEPAIDHADTLGPFIAAARNALPRLIREIKLQRPLDPKASRPGTSSAGAAAATAYNTVLSTPLPDMCRALHRVFVAFEADIRAQIAAQQDPRP